MTLREKLNDSIITNINIVESENRMCYNYNHLELAEVCEKIADEFAIDFADWYLDLWLNDNNSSFDNNSPKKLLEIFKKEKGY
jgi:hypothetical protein